MATVTKPTKATEADLSGETVTEVEKNDNAPKGAAEVSKDDISQTLRLLRFKLSALQADARRKRPFMSATPDEARAKLNSALVVLREFTEQTL